MRQSNEISELDHSFDLIIYIEKNKQAPFEDVQPFLQLPLPEYHPCATQEQKEKESSRVIIIDI
jgi:hypothetical protein